MALPIDKLYINIANDRRIKGIIQFAQYQHRQIFCILPTQYYYKQKATLQYLKFIQQSNKAQNSLLASFIILQILERSLISIINHRLMSIKQIQGYCIHMNKVLGKGSFGSVYLGVKDSTSEEVAVKILSKDSIDRDQYLKAALKNQIEILQKLHSDNIVGFYDVMESSKNYYVFQQLCDGDLSMDIQAGKQHSEQQGIELLRQICNGFLALVKEGVIHRDLKPANIMKKSKVLKLGDFGFAKKMGYRKMVSTCVGTPLYMSLQILKGEEYTSKCDVWALGIIFYQILHGELPWTATTESQLVKNIQKIPLNIKRKDLSAQTQDFLRKCLQLKQCNRISWDEIFAHPIFKEYFLSKNDSRQFENKMKMIMNKLRFYVSHKNLDMKKIMDSLGFGQGKQEVSYQDFYHFFQRVYPQITNQEADFVFKKTDTDNSSTISLQELKQLLLHNGIKIKSQFDNVPSFEKRQDGKETFKRLSPQTSAKIKNCFEKLYKIINKNNLTLEKVFNDFDQKKGQLNLTQFSKLMNKVCSNYITIFPQEIKSGFDLIDEDSSNSIQFPQLDKYYSKINGVPQTGTRKYDQEELQILKQPIVRRQKREQKQYSYQPIGHNMSYSNLHNQANSGQLEDTQRRRVVDSGNTAFNPFAILGKRI